MIKECKVRTYRGFVIAESNGNYPYLVYSKDEWSYGKGLRTAEFECDNLQECIDNINDVTACG